MGIGIRHAQVTLALTATLVITACGSDGSVAAKAHTTVKGTTISRRSSSTTSSPGKGANKGNRAKKHGTQSGGKGTGSAERKSHTPTTSRTTSPTTPPPTPASTQPRPTVTTRQANVDVWGETGIYRAGPGGAGCDIAYAEHGAGQLPTRIPVVAGEVIASHATGLINTGLRNEINDLPPEGGYPVDRVNTTYPPARSIAVSAANGLSGISGDRVGFIVGVFTGAGPVQSGMNGAVYTYPYRPVVNQVFFVGDGAAYTRSIVVPTGATALWLGIADAWDTQAKTITGCPGFYDDNSGPVQRANQPNWTPDRRYTVNVRITHYG
jgi:hypothetical protein